MGGPPRVPPMVGTRQLACVSGKQKARKRFVASFAREKGRSPSLSPIPHSNSDDRLWDFSRSKMQGKKSRPVFLEIEGMGHQCSIARVLGHGTLEIEYAHARYEVLSGYPLHDQVSFEIRWCRECFGRIFRIHRISSRTKAAIAGPPAMISISWNKARNGPQQRLSWGEVSERALMHISS